ncbi:DUF221 domain protein [Aspergillus campestris IBT 28561]|uniref:DUF221 domain protein n=1 Tax=Aspergillus campestris (strain IBT 28561) TaxID=1392248 RepID=A0A2I1DFJ6_ASPC2|nr:DUF221 domain protein [Aspergillus campestris IBT 28561]PKY08638.1 DUF221 domain protein [Aspergillus campestris IBT 28561]
MADFRWFDVLVKRQDLLDPNNDPNVGSAQGNASTKTSETMENFGVEGSTSLSALITTLLPALVIAVFWFGLFLICRRTQQRWYAPRTHLPCWHEHERSPELPSGFLNWFGSFLKISDDYVLHSSSMDGYLFLRFIRVLSSTCFTGCLITWPILLPIHATGGAGNTQLDMLSFSNVKDPTRYYAHAVVAIIFFTFVFYVVTRESIFYANLRQAYLNSPAYIHRISSRTVLFMSVPEDYKNEKKLRQVFGESIRRIWITSDCKELQKQVSRQETLAYRLESAETKLIRAANSARRKVLKKGSLTNEARHDCEAGRDFSVYHHIKRPTHRPKMFGKKVDTIRWLREQLREVTEEVNHLQQKHKDGEVKYLSAVFIEFETQNDAQVALQTLSHHQPMHMTPRYIGISPQEVVWSALNLSWWQRVVRKFAVKGGIAALIVFWSVPAAAVGLISNITYLTKTLPFLGFIDKLPDEIKGVISGLLPSGALVLLMSLVPIICRFCARCAGVPSNSHVELFTQSAHFCFQVVQVFLVTTLTSAASAATQQIIKDPLSAKDLLAENLPKATNFYIAYFLLQGLTMSSMAVVQVAGVLVFKFMATFFDRSPRQLYQRWSALGGISWGNIFPVFTNMGVIALTYSCIAPLILGFAFIGLYLVYQAYRYNLLFVYDLRIDTKGLVYPRALQHLLTGIYLANICMIGLFAIKSAIGPLIIMVLFTIVTTLAHMSLNDALQPLNTFLPRTLATEEATQKTKQDSFRTDTDASTSPTSTSTTHPHIKQVRSRWAAAWKWFHPNLYRDYAALRRKVRREHVEIKCSEEERFNAYYEPCVKARLPTLWIPRDKWGFSAQEVMETPSEIAITDERAHLDERNRIVWDKYDPHLPLWELKILY